MKDRRSDEWEIAGHEVAWGLGAIVAVLLMAWVLALGVTWMHDGHLPPARSAVQGTVQLVGQRQWSHPAAAYPRSVRRHMPRSPTAWWAGGAWAAGTLLALGYGTWRRLDVLAARSNLGRRPFQIRGSRPRSWARRRDLCDLIVRKRTPGRFTLGTLNGSLLASDPEAHVAVIAPTRAGKTTRLVIPWLLEHDGPAIVTSTKPDVLDATRTWREKRGTVSVWDPFGPESTNWTPLTGCTEWAHALQQAQWLADAAQQGDSEVASYWRGEAARLLAPLLHAAAVADGSIVHVLAWIDAQETKRPSEILKAAGDPAARRQLNGITALDPRNRGTIYMSAGSLLAAYRHPDVQRTATDGLTPEHFLNGAANTLYVIASSRQQRLLAPFVVALLSGVLHAAAERANVRGPLNPTLRVLLDETANIAPIRDLPAHLSQAAGHGIRIATIWQSLAQAQERYGQGAESILANSTAKLYLGPITDDTTRREITGLLGKHEIRDGSRRRHIDGQAARLGPHPKAEPAELQQLLSGRALLVNGSNPPAIVRQQPWWTEPVLKKRT